VVPVQFVQKTIVLPEIAGIVSRQEVPHNVGAALDEWYDVVDVHNAG
jgi:hypothetical protein